MKSDLKQYGNIYVVNNIIYSNSTSNSLFGVSFFIKEDLESRIPERFISNIVVCNNTIHTVGRSGIRTAGWFADESGNRNACRMSDFYNVKLSNNVVHNLGQVGIYVTGTTNGEISRNHIYDAGLFNYEEMLEGDAGIMVVSSRNIDVTYNQIHDIYDASINYDGMGIDIDWNTSNINVQYNHTYGCVGAGIATMANQNCFIRNNRVENNLCRTNTNAQIFISNFTTVSGYIDSGYHSVNYLTVEDNLIIGKDTRMFATAVANGTSEWKGNVFKNNRIVNKSVKSDGYWIDIQDGAPWHCFKFNCYYAQKTYGRFNVYDCSVDIDSDAQRFKNNGRFSSWAKRDVGAVLTTLSDAAPSQPEVRDITFVNGTVTISWGASAGDVRNYKIFLTDFDEGISYANLLGETTSTMFEFTPRTKGEYYFAVVPESYCGVYGKAIKLKVVLG